MTQHRAEEKQQGALKVSEHEQEALEEKLDRWKLETAKMDKVMLLLTRQRNMRARELKLIYKRERDTGGQIKARFAAVPPQSHPAR